MEKEKIYPQEMEQGRKHLPGLSSAESCSPFVSSYLKLFALGRQAEFVPWQCSEDLEERQPIPEGNKRKQKKLFSLF